MMQRLWKHLSPIRPGLPVLTGLLMLGSLLLTGIVQAHELTQGYDLSWHTIDGGGYTWSEGGGYTLGGTVGQPDAGAAPSGGGYVLTGGFWVGGPAAPAAVTDLAASNDGGYLRLDWSAVTQDVEGNSIAGVTYDVYRAQDLPYFSPSAPYATGVSSTTYPDPDAGVIGDPGHSHFYLVRAAYGGLTSSDSNRVGSFPFALAPGSP
jgi:hypothetical protein